MHKDRIMVNTGEDGRYGAMSKPNWHLSFMNLSITLSNNTIGGERYKLPRQGNKNASTNSAPGSGKRV